VQRQANLYSLIIISFIAFILLIVFPSIQQRQQDKQGKPNKPEIVAPLKNARLAGGHGKVKKLESTGSATSIGERKMASEGGGGSGGNGMLMAESKSDPESGG
jgi:hypothetical protein